MTCNDFTTDCSHTILVSGPPASTKHHTLNLPDLKYAVAYSLLKPNNLLENNRRKTIANAEKWNLHCSQYH